VSLATRLLNANPGAQVTTALTGALTTPGAKGVFFDGDFQSISSQTITANTTQITLNSIPSTYSSLQLRIFAKKDTGANDAIALHFNNDMTNSNYGYHCMLGDGASSTQSVIASRADMGSVRSAAWNTTVIDIPDYTSTTKTKVRRSLSGSMTIAAGSVFYFSGSWNNTAAITRIDIRTSNGNDFIPGSVFALYGLKG